MAKEQVKIAWWHKKRIQKLFKERFDIEELYIMYKEVIPHSQIRGLVRGVQRDERI